MKIRLPKLEYIEKVNKNIISHLIIPAKGIEGNVTLKNESRIVFEDESQNEYLLLFDKYSDIFI